MFRRSKPQPFDITEHPDVLKALESMWQQAYETGCRDQVAKAQDFLEEVRARPSYEAQVDDLSVIDDVIGRLESW